MDSLGRRRAPGQQRGLRPLYPPLPPGVRSRSIRVAMREEAWVRLEAEVAAAATTAPRTVGRLVERALDVTDWQEWQIRKERQLLESA